MKLFNTKVTAMAAAVSLVVTASASQAAGPGIGSTPYEVWGSDQSNSVAGAGARGVAGSYLWIWRGEDVGTKIKGKGIAEPVGCDGSNTPGDGPCDLREVFPASLAEHDGTTTTGETLDTSPSFGRLHGMIADPQNMYMNINSFVPGGGYVGIVDGVTKEAVALWRVTQTSAPSGNGRSLHMSFWNSDGSALLLANLHGRILERIDVTRDADGRITGADFNRAASINVGTAATVLDDATAFQGLNAHGNALVSSVSGDYDVVALGAKTPSGADKQGAERPTNVIVCPIVSSNDNAYITFGGGGLLVADTSNTPMNIVAEYDQATVNGAGCGGVEDEDGFMWLNAGASAGGAGATQSTFSMYAIDDNALTDGGVNSPNTPMPLTVFKDAGNTMTIGNDFGPASISDGQLPGVTTRRDAHGAARTLDGKYVHNADRLQNNVEVFDTLTQTRVGTYDLTSANGKGNGAGPCAATSVTDDPGLPGNDPAPDLMGTTPDGKYLVVALRGPIPVSVGHNAQGSCPGVGIIALRDNGASGKLVTVLRSTNTVDDAPASAPGGHAYTGTEHSDPHGASVRTRVEDQK
jgi:hypothetical protein